MAVCLAEETQHGSGNNIATEDSTEECSQLSAEIFGKFCLMLSCTIDDFAPNRRESDPPIPLCTELIRDIRDPEREETLEELDVVQDTLITVARVSKSSSYHVRIEFVPTVQHCSLANTIGKGSTVRSVSSMQKC